MDEYFGVPSTGINLGTSNSTFSKTSVSVKRSLDANDFLSAIVPNSLHAGQNPVLLLHAWCLKWLCFNISEIVFSKTSSLYFIFL